MNALTFLFSYTTILTAALAFTGHQNPSFLSKGERIRNGSTCTCTHSHHRIETLIQSEIIDGGASSSSSSSSSSSTEENTEWETFQISSPLKFLGPYPSLGLRFPSLATASQRERDVCGISLDFVLDTAANVNTINAAIAEELQLEGVGSALPGYAAGGAIDGGETFMLGNCTLDTPDAEMFMVDLSASALGVPSPASAGILGVAFLNVFQGGVKFQWGGGVQQSDPLVTFYAEKEGVQDQLDAMTKVPIHVIDEIKLPTVMLNINGATIPALLDTGSPVTVFNSIAAETAGLEVFEMDNEQSNQSSSGGGAGFVNPFKKMADDFKAAQATAQAASRGDILMMMGPDGPIQLAKTKHKESISLGTGSDIVSFPKSHMYVGNLPGLAAVGLEGGSSSPSPAAILGMDVIKRLPVMVYRENEVYF